MKERKIWRRIDSDTYTYGLDGDDEVTVYSVIMVFEEEPELVWLISGNDCPYDTHPIDDVFDTAKDAMDAVDRLYTSKEAEFEDLGYESDDPFDGGDDMSTPDWMDSYTPVLAARKQSGVKQ